MHPTSPFTMAVLLVGIVSTAPVEVSDINLVERADPVEIMMDCTNLEDICNANAFAMLCEGVNSIM